MAETINLPRHISFRDAQAVSKHESLEAGRSNGVH